MGNRDVVTITGREAVVYENSLYRIVVGQSELRPPTVVVTKKDQDAMDMAPDVYKIVNIKWDVVEDEQHKLPQAMFTAGLLEMQMQQQGWVKALTEEKEKNEKETPQK